MWPGACQVLAAVMEDDYMSSIQRTIGRNIKRSLPSDDKPSLTGLIVVGLFMAVVFVVAVIGVHYVKVM